MASFYFQGSLDDQSSVIRMFTLAKAKEDIVYIVLYSLLAVELTIYSSLAVGTMSFKLFEIGIVDYVDTLCF